jgi:hypothetical protein
VKSDITDDEADQLEEFVNQKHRYGKLNLDTLLIGSATAMWTDHALSFPQATVLIHLSDSVRSALHITVREVLGMRGLQYNQERH